ncbi:hypothetical protein [Lysobacter enzymogenes]|uniref:Uncharacterized protein n=1 Tax=Lysobacter enzymogenes TaxID=69 RepID=A0AAU9AGS2_LYSEN|nr:hypothetical protein [Lysobacter enzymogenes]BAV97926.1 hypothetical protein LEN_2439 [Lysobacter enzymogenes]
MGMHAYETDRQTALVVDAEAEIAHWRARYRDLPHCRYMRWDDVKPALQLGIDACLKANGRDVVEMLEELETRYRRTGKDSRLDWRYAREVVAAVWVRIWDQNKSRGERAASFAAASSKPYGSLTR